MSQYLVGRWGEPATWPRDPEKVLLGLDAFIERNLLEEPANRKSVALVFEYAQFLLPTSDLDSLAQGHAARLVRFLVLGAESAHQAREHGVRADRRQAGRAERAAGPKPARGDDRDSAAGPRRARAVRARRHGRPGAVEAGRFHGRATGGNLQRPEPHESATSCWLKRRAPASGSTRRGFASSRSR